MMAVREVEILDVRPGDKIVEGGKIEDIGGTLYRKGQFRIHPVKNVDRDGCDRTHIHINDTMCYHHRATVTLPA